MHPQWQRAGMEDLIHSSKILICTGTGGVGKTTVSAALGMLSSQLGYRTLILTIDPARRLASALGITLEHDEEAKVPCESPLFASMVIPSATFAQFIRKASGKVDTIGRLAQNRLYLELSTTLSGSQEFT